MKKASAKIRNKVKTKLAQSINRMEGMFGGRESNKPDDFKDHLKKRK
ncbi:MAG: hypothetical protein NTU89_02050 [Candidatus Dependentiae bacterium]|nr:hypothetical protein [Candidatus Dependentiae bacterium]